MATILYKHLVRHHHSDGHFRRGRSLEGHRRYEEREHSRHRHHHGHHGHHKGGEYMKGRRHHGHWTHGYGKCACDSESSADRNLPVPQPQIQDTEGTQTDSPCAHCLRHIERRKRCQQDKSTTEDTANSSQDKAMEIPDKVVEKWRKKHGKHGRHGRHGWGVHGDRDSHFHRRWRCCVTMVDVGVNTEDVAVEGAPQEWVMLEENAREVQEIMENMSENLNISQHEKSAEE